MPDLPGNPIASRPLDQVMVGLERYRNLMTSVASCPQNRLAFSVAAGP